MRASEFTAEGVHPHQKNVDHFVNWVSNKLHLKEAPPKIVFSNDTKLARSKHRTGYYNEDKNLVYVYTGHRNLVDIFRTLAHELVHKKQGEEGRIKQKSPPGSPNEREADWRAGYLMKLYLKNHPETIDETVQEARIRPTGNDSPQAWIDYFLTSDHPNLKGKDPETLKRMALAARNKAVYNPPKPKPMFKASKPNPNVRYWWQEKDESVEEGWKDWVAGAGAAAMIAGGGGAAYDAYKANKAQDEKPAVTAQASDTAKPKSDFKKGIEKLSKDAVPATSVTGSPHEKFLTGAAVAAGIKGEELAQFLAQTAHESHNFKTMVEYGDSDYFKKYEPKFLKDKKTKKVIIDPKTKKPKNFNPKAVTLGNTMPGDGEKYKGRGYIQLTGKWNYEQAGKALGLDLVKNPQLVEKPEVAAKVAVWFWQNRVQPKVADFGNTKAATKPINPGLKHLDQRKEKFQTFKTVMR